MICFNKFNSSRLRGFKHLNFILMTINSLYNNKKSFKLLLFIKMIADNNLLNSNNSHNIKDKILIIKVVLIIIRLPNIKLILFNKIKWIILNLEKK